MTLRGGRGYHAGSVGESMRGKKGFALIEVLIATGLLLGVAGVLVALTNRSGDTARRSEASEAAALFLRTMVAQSQELPLLGCRPAVASTGIT